MKAKSTDLPEQRGLAWCFAMAIFISAFLVFQVQPVISKVILPWFGGSPAVWTSCLLFFQTALFAGYAYAHWSVSRLSPKWQGGLHLLLIAVALCVLPITPSPDWKPVDGAWPTLRILGILTTSVGLPYFLLASSGPLLQAWFGQSFQNRSPYRLYALSNTASMLGLLTYPFVFEPAFTTLGQGQLWSLVFIVFALFSAWLAWRPIARASRPNETQPATATAAAVDPATIPPVGSRLGWLALAAYGTAMLLATTNHVCQDVAVMPLLWVIPLSLYLLSFIICFDNPRWYSRYWFGRGLVLSTMLATIVTRSGGMFPVMVEIVVFFALLLMACMVCHGELVRRRPDKSHLTMFYQYCAAGGALGGLLVSLICPQLFNEFLEMNVGMLIAYLLGLYVVGSSGAVARRQERRLAPYVVGYAGLLAIAWGQFGGTSNSAIAASRNFYGVLTVAEQEVPDANQSPKRLRELLHGRIQHGSQWLDEELRRVPTTYYAEETAVGQLLRGMGEGASLRVGVIGLGAGTLAAYGRAGDTFRFYEINPDVVEIAQRYFTYLADLPAESDLVLGDARISLERESPQAFDVLVLDAFSGDAVPAHLLTVEAVEIYLSHINEGGALAIHISNRHIDLLPVVAGICRHKGLHWKHVPTRMNLGNGVGTCEWVVISREAARLQSLEGEAAKARSFGQDEQLPLWTDNYSNIIGSLRRAE
ncbi:MAG: fused MFS/spermidine synthase [Planctomycetales bacterium]|nr:fused MFS/spermidine synthase [Planctomycetales bacterium]